MYRLCIPLFALALAAGCGDDPSDISYPNSKAGLEKLVADLEGDNGDNVAKSLKLPDAEAWYEKHFEPEVAARLLDAYEPNADRFGELPKVFEMQRQRGRTDTLIEVFEDPDNQLATTHQAVALRAMTERVPLWSIRLVEPGDDGGQHLSNFVHDGTSFRFVGQLERVKGGPRPKPEVEALASLRQKDAKYYLETGKFPE